MKATQSALALLSLAAAAKAANLTLIQEYSGSTFFDDWQFYGDTTTNINGTAWNGSHPYDDFTNGLRFAACVLVKVLIACAQGTYSTWAKQMAVTSTVSTPPPATPSSRSIIHPM